MEQVIADAPSGHFQANATSLALAALAHNLTRAAGTLAGAFHSRATTANDSRPSGSTCLPAWPAPPAASPSPCVNAGPWRDDFLKLFTAMHAPPPIA